MDRPRPMPVCVLPLVLLPLLLHAGCEGCKGHGDPDLSPAAEVTASPHGIAGNFEAGAASPATPGPWNVGIALFDEVAFDPDTLEALDEPSLWETFQVDALPARFSVDLGASFSGWVLVILDDDGSGLPGTPQEGDLIGVAPGVVTAPATDIRIYLENIWER